MILHMINNALAYLMLMMKYQERTATDFIYESNLYGILYAISAVGVLFAAIKIVRRLRKQKFLLAYLSAEEVEVAENSGADANE